MATMQQEMFRQEIDVKVSAKRMWYGLVKDSHNCLPKCMPEKIEKVEYEGGRYAEVGSVRVIKFHKGHYHFQQVKEKFEEIDENHLKVKLHVIEGGFLGILFHNYDIHLEFREGIVSWSVHYRALTHKKCPDEVIEMMTSRVKAVEAYLLVNTEVYPY